MRVVELVGRPDEAMTARLQAASDAITAALGRPAFSDHLRLDLADGGAPGFRAVVVAEPERALAVAQVSAANNGLVMEVATAPDVPLGVSLDAAETLLDSIRRTGDAGTSITWWVDAAGDAARVAVGELAAANGLTPTRSLHEMRRTLPHPDRAAVTTRAFVTGDDDEALLRVNNRAFEAHPEQGGWTLDTLALRLREPWFDPNGLRLYEEDGRLLGFCWTKIHDPQSQGSPDSQAGEIYVIGIDPDAHGRGLGHQLTLAGLDSIAARGVTAALLYVDAANAAAVRLYDRLGFTVERTRVAFSGTLEPR
jgi:mycothiol synthase